MTCKQKCCINNSQWTFCRFHLQREQYKQQKHRHHFFSVGPHHITDCLVQHHLTYHHWLPQLPWLGGFTFYCTSWFIFPFWYCHPLCFYPHSHLYFWSIPPLLFWCCLLFHFRSFSFFLFPLQGKFLFRYLFFHQHHNHYWLNLLYHLYFCLCFCHICCFQFNLCFPYCFDFCEPVERYLVWFCVWEVEHIPVVSRTVTNINSDNPKYNIYCS